MHTAIPTVRDHIIRMQHMTLDQLHALRSQTLIGAANPTPREYAAVLVLISLKSPARAGKGAK